MPTRERTVRLQPLLSSEEEAAIEDFRYQEHMPTRAAAVRELLKRGILAGASDPPKESS